MLSSSPQAVAGQEKCKERRPATLVIGLTGGIATGKSSVAAFLRELGAHVIDADSVGHSVYKKGSPAWREVVQAFGEQVIGQDAEIDRKRLGSLVFNDAEALARLNAITHPKMYNIFESEIERLRAEGVQVIVLDAAVLIEAGWSPLVDEIWLVHASDQTVLARLKEKGVPREQALRRLRAQTPFAEKARHAAVIIHNEGNREELKQKVVQAWDNRVRRRPRWGIGA